MFENTQERKYWWLLIFQQTLWDLSTAAEVSTKSLDQVMVRLVNFSNVI